ncbi:guanine nucleotide-binding subunit gamma 3 [Olea europaea subsp. europaea]|uniref:Guanine nucleotide-binding subunit gamma 3 n=1 Tax=Olea europaea subsp. europaea TaxID=158383 RepID=A0A8S0TTJ1_OLEEU|nr:guanine nucleotide-binding subunit gamma 3 [Olea europaea subsp. europaea]
MGDSVGTGTVPPLPPPLPKSPPQYPDLYGKRRELAKVQILEREISFLEEELRSVEGLLPASRSCKEIADFVTGKSDPLIPITKKVRRSYRFWKWLCGISCFNLSLICCCPKCPHLHMPHCCKCNLFVDCVAAFRNVRPARFVFVAFPNVRLARFVFVLPEDVHVVILKVQR